MTRAFFMGIGRAAKSPTLLLFLWLLTVLVALPSAVWLSESIHGSVGKSLVSDNLREGFDLGWFGEYENTARGLEKTFGPTVTGAGAFFNNLEAWFGGGLFTMPRGLVALGLLYALVWAWIMGGILDHIRHGGGGLSLRQFSAAGSTYVLRFIRLAVVSGLCYYLIYRLARRLFPWIEHLTRDVTSERTILLLHLLAAAGILFLFVFVRMVFDYAKISMVVEERRSALVTTGLGMQFVVLNPLRTFALYVGYALIGLAVLAVYAWFAPGAGQSTPLAIAIAFLIGQGVLLAKLFVRVATLGGEMTLFEGFRRRAPVA